ncbi:MAG: acetyl-CoA C-acyltransferase, partial [Pseudorhodoplanes sp.]|nr:acetyl-CoA C-acyltransferase [Pseudorhodoplanes sp.]
MSRQVVITAGVRTAIGGFGGSLSGMAPGALGALCAREALRRADVAADEVGQVVFGNVVLTESQDAYLARVAA